MNTAGTLRDWALGLVAVVLIMGISLPLMIETKPQGWPLERYALLIAAVMCLPPMLFRRLRSSRNH